MGKRLVIRVTLLSGLLLAGQGMADEKRLDGKVFRDLVSESTATRLAAVMKIDAHWHPDDAVMLIEAWRVIRERSTREAIYRVLTNHTGRSYRTLNDWFAWVWKRDYQPHPEYMLFKQAAYGVLDRRFKEYFDPEFTSLIRLDEVRWGGVLRDGIPPLSNPQTISAAEADWLADSDVVFGVRFGGQARAYPKRILAWHEMVKDTVGGQPINGVYCTLCGSMIVYDPVVEGVHHELGTSGFLYRSNKLMYDHRTRSLWSTIKGEPVIGPLVNRGIRLRLRHVVTTTWGEWKKRHPDTDVLSLETGHKRDYGEGVAYQKYFATDRLMFNTPFTDTRLKNKASVLVIRRSKKPPVAIEVSFLRKQPVYQLPDVNGGLTVVTDTTGACRVYETGAVQLVGWLSEDSLKDQQERTWKMTEEELSRSGSDVVLKRHPAHNAFWFGLLGSHPDAELIR